jgi:hypothetical protein
MKKKKLFTPILINAAQMARQYPDTFGRPPKSELDKLQRGDFAKVSDNQERFWVIITQRDGDIFTGKIDNHVGLGGQPYRCGDLIRFSTDNIYQLDRNLSSRARG